jgi:hypothetical protein
LPAMLASFFDVAIAVSKCVALATGFICPGNPTVHRPLYPHIADCKK